MAMYNFSPKKLQFVLLKKKRVVGELRKQTLFNLFTDLIFVTKCEPHNFFVYKSSTMQ